MRIKLRDYQQKLYEGIFEKIDADVIKLCVQLETGGGKSVVIGKLATELPGRSLILTHRAEILEQNAEWVSRIGHLTAKENTVTIQTQVAIAMVQTLHARIKKYGPLYLGKFDNIILDEVHIQIFAKVFNLIPHDILIGFTATPVLNKRRTIVRDGIEFTQDITLSEIFDDIVTGPSTKELIELGHLVQDHSVVLKVPNFDHLVESASQPDGYTTKSLNEVYNNRASIDVLLDAIEKYCKGKKTLLFNSTTESNIFVYDALNKLGYNVKYYDSVNSKAADRKAVVQWFVNETDAILVGTNVFTTGFNVTDIEVVIMNRATKSLGLFIQCAGRGSRTTDKIYKDHFTLIDLGQNIPSHGTWSQDRDWRDYFFPQPPKRKRKTDLLQVWECNYCGYYNLKGDVICESCGAEKKGSEKIDKPDKIGELVELSPSPLPRAETLISYVKSVDESTDFAFRLLETRILELFISRRIKAEEYVRKEKNFVRRVEEIYRPIYFVIIKSGLRGKRRRLTTQFAKMRDKIDKHFKINKYGKERKLVTR